MNLNINDVNIEYYNCGKGKPIIFLHGWGSNKQIFNNIINNLNEEFELYSLDLPGFGNSPIGNHQTIDDYVNTLNGFITKLQIKNPIIIAHSFGGRIAIKYAFMHPVKELVLIGVPGIRKVKLKNKIKILLYKFFKIFKVRLNTGSADYISSDDKKQKLLVNVVNEDLKKYLKMIETNTTLIWGSNDKEVDLRIAKKMRKMLSNSKLFIINGGGHFPFIAKTSYFLIILKSVLYRVEYD